MDSGASHHLTSDLDNLAIHSEYTSTAEVTIGNGKTLPISNLGHYSMLTNSNTSLALSNILHVPSIFHNLLFVHALSTSNPVSIEFFSNRFFVKDLHTRKVICQGENRNGVYCLPLKPQSVESIKPHVNVALST